MSNRSSNSTRSHSPSSPLPSTSPQSMLHVLPAPILRPSSAHYTPHLSHTPRASPSSSQLPPPEPMRAPESSRGTKRARGEEREGEEEERQGSFSESETSENTEQPVLPAPKKRTRTLMTPDQLTALHRLLSMTRFPTTEQREQCGREIGLSARRVQVWFQNQRQKSKAQQQATSSSSSALAGGSHVQPRSSGYQVFNYATSHYDPPSRPYTSPHPYGYDEPPHYHLQHMPATSPAPRSNRLGYHRRGTSSISYNAPSTGRHEYPPAGYLLPAYAVEEAEFAHAPYYEPHHSPPTRIHSRSPELSRHAPQDDTLAPIWPENERVAGPSRTYSSSSDVLNPIAPPPPGSTRPALLPTGLPPPQPLEPTPLWSHPHTNPRYMRPLPPASSMPSLLGGLNRGRARSDPPVSSLPPSSHGRPPRPILGLGLQLHGIRDSENPAEANEDALTSPERTASDPTVVLRSESRVVETRAETSRGERRMHPYAHSRRSSKDSRDQED
ncbi:hypothetical protein BDV93DRAFT_524346 [Ceratobasidium sp. AG-I]|nr:hypothetical protein BDV93DRAFT_524346 [Ceratobasidium sp. AG-I]